MRKYLIVIALFLQALVCSSQLPVSKEPRHQNVFENSYVRVLDVRMSPRDTSLFHKHETPSVFVMLQPVKTGSEVIQEETKATILSGDAEITFEGFYTTPRVHRVWNEDSVEFHVMDIEILAKEQLGGPALQNKALKLLFDEKPVRGYRLLLKPKSNHQLKSKNPILIIGLTDSSEAVSVNKQSFARKGDFIFIQKDNTIEFSNRDQQPYSFAILEIK